MPKSYQREGQPRKTENEDVSKISMFLKLKRVLYGAAILDDIPMSCYMILEILKFSN